MAAAITLLSFFSEWASAWSDALIGIILVVLGIILIVVEMFMPGFGIAGVSGSVCLIVGLVLGSDTLAGAMFSLLIIVLLLVITAAIIFRSVLKGKLSRSPVVLNTAIDGGSTELFDADMQQLVGKTGVAESALRPSGIIVVDGKRLDVISEAEFIDKGTTVKITSVQGTRILVKRV